MPEELLKSQFNALEEPSGAITVDISDPQEVIVQKIRVSLGI
jgi:gluconokinase